MAVTCWSYMAVRKLISLNRNASNFPRAIILCPQQNKRVIFLKMRGIEIFDKSYGKCCTFDCGNCSFHKHLACLIWECGPGAGERGLKAKNCYFSLKSRICFKKALWVGGFMLSVHCAIKGKLQGSCFELPATSQLTKRSHCRTDGAFSKNEHLCSPLFTESLLQNALINSLMLLCKPKTFYTKEGRGWEDWGQGQIDAAQAEKEEKQAVFWLES